MIVYSGNIRQFNLDVDNRVIADRIKEELEKIGINHNNPSEYNAWDQSLLHMKNVLSDPDFHLDTKVAIEYKLPTTSKRVDFLISGKDDNDLSKVIVIELKQWEKAYKTEKEDLVETFVGGNMRLVTHPSYQAYSYAKTIENFSEYVQLEKIVLHPCSYLHNYQEEFRGEIDNSFYNHIVSISPLFLKHDTLKLREFIKKYIKKPDDGEILYQIDHGKIRPSKALQDTLVSMLEGNEEYYMIDEQKVVYSSIKSIIEKNIDLSGKHTIIVEGGPGTGKSVVAINLLVNFRHLNASYVTKNSAPRNVYFEKLRRGKYKWQYVKNLFKSSGVFVDSSTNEFDCLFVDEAHRLNRKTGFFGKGENQIKEIINAAKISVFFIDENQRVTTKDMILRKGAISAYKGEKLIIPLNMRDGCIIGVGKGNKLFNKSAPHGAGRLMLRKEALRTLDLEDFKRDMEGIYSTSVNRHTLDEAPIVYKPTDMIIEHIKDTVDIVKIIKPIYNFKAK